jgi:hypothetical protein
MALALKTSALLPFGPDDREALVIGEPLTAKVIDALDRCRVIADVAAVLAGEEPHFPVNAVAPR